MPITFVQAIAREEGFEDKGSRPQRNNNPGDLEFGKFTIAHGATKGDPKFAVFPTVTDGWNALTALVLSTGYRGDTVAQFFDRYAPPVENNTNLYTEHVCEWVGCKPTDLVSALMTNI